MHGHDAEEHQDDQDEQQRAKATGGAVAPFAAVRPHGRSAEKQKKDDDQKNESHRKTPISRAYNELSNWRAGLRCGLAVELAVAEENPPRSHEGHEAVPGWMMWGGQIKSLNSIFELMLRGPSGLGWN